ncbi:5476_t:CDS:2, partial [Gigaspora margarita]
MGDDFEFNKSGSKKHIPRKKVPKTNSQTRAKTKKLPIHKDIIDLSKLIQAIQKKYVLGLSSEEQEKANGVVGKIREKYGIEISEIVNTDSTSLFEWVFNAKSCWRALRKLEQLEEEKSMQRRIRKAVDSRYEKIDGKPGKMLASILKRPFKKVSIDRVLEQTENERVLYNEPSEVLERTKMHYQNQFKEREVSDSRELIEEFYQPLREINENWYRKLTIEISRDEWLVEERYVEIDDYKLYAEERGSLTRFLGVWLTTLVNEKLVEKKAKTVVGVGGLGRYKSLAQEIFSKQFTGLQNRLNSYDQLNELTLIRRNDGILLASICNETWEQTRNEVLRKVWKNNLTNTVLVKASKHGITFKSDSNPWKIYGTGLQIYEVLNNKVFLRYFTESQRRRKTLWFDIIEKKIMKDWQTRKIVESFTCNEGNKLSMEIRAKRLSSDKRKREWVLINKENESSVIGKVLKKGSKQVLVNHWTVEGAADELRECSGYRLKKVDVPSACQQWVKTRQILGVLPKVDQVENSKLPVLVSEVQGFRKKNRTLKLETSETLQLERIRIFGHDESLIRVQCFNARLTELLVNQLNANLRKLDKGGQRNYSRLDLEMAIIGVSNIKQRERHESYVRGLVPAEVLENLGELTLLCSERNLAMQTYISSFERGFHKAVWKRICKFVARWEEEAGICTKKRQKVRVAKEDMPKKQGMVGQGASIVSDKSRKMNAKEKQARREEVQRLFDKGLDEI